MTADKRPKTKKRVERPCPPDDRLPGRDGPVWTETPRDLVVCAVDPADTSGWAVVSSYATGAKLVGSGTTRIGEPGGCEAVIDRGIRVAEERNVPLVFVSEHSRAPHQSGGFGIDGFIGMIRCQGAWLRAYNTAVRVAWESRGVRAGRRQVCLPGRYTLVTPNDWRTHIYGTRKYIDPETEKSLSLQRGHLKYLARKIVKELVPGLEPSEDEAEAILLAFWGSRRARV